METTPEIEKDKIYLQNKIEVLIKERVKIGKHILAYKKSFSKEKDNRIRGLTIFQLRLLDKKFGENVKRIEELEEELVWCNKLIERNTEEENKKILELPKKGTVH